MGIEESRNLNRCSWVKEKPLEIAYHDEEWGIPITDDQKLFEFLILEGAQAGKSQEYSASETGKLSIGRRIIVEFSKNT